MNPACIMLGQESVFWYFLFSSSLLLPNTGIFGMDFYVVLQRPGFRVARKKHCKGVLGNKQRILKKDAMQWFIKKYDGVISKKKAALVM